MPLIQNQVVDINGWLTLAEFTDLITISEMTPGPIAVNAATFTGTRIAGLGGALAATLGCIAPACVIVSLLAWTFNKHGEVRLIKGTLSGLRPAVIALIMCAGLSMLVLSFWGHDGISFDIGALDITAVLLFITGIILIKKLKRNPIFVMLVCGALGALFYLL